MTKTVNYTQEDTNKLIALYDELGNDKMDEIAKEMGKSIPSVRSKLVREGVYVPQDKTVKAKKIDGPSKKDLLAELRALTGGEHDGLMGATKAAIQEIIDLLPKEEE